MAASWKPTANPDEGQPSGLRYQHRHCGPPQRVFLTIGSLQRRRALFAAEGDDEDVTVAWPRGIERFDRRHAVKDAVVVGEGGVERLSQGEAAERLFREIVDAGFAALHIDAADEQDEHPIDAVAVHALGGRAAFPAGARLDAELMALDMPGIGPHVRRRQAVEQTLAG